MLLVCVCVCVCVCVQIIATGLSASLVYCFFHQSDIIDPVTWETQEKQIVAMCCVSSSHWF